jgi:hypothetical protein
MLPRTYGCEELGQRGSELLRTPLPLTSVNKSKTTRSSLRRSELRLVLIPCPYVLGFPVSLPFSGQRKCRNRRSEPIRSMGVPYLHISDPLEQRVSGVLFGIA